MRVALSLLAMLTLGFASDRAAARQMFPATGSPVALCLLAAHDAGVLEAIPDGLMARLAEVESGRLSAGESASRPWPWSIDADGTDLAFETQAQAVEWAARAPRRGVKFLDAGCLQVNLQYHPLAFADLVEAFDPWSNARHAARYLRSLYEESGHDWSVAVGWYHSHTPELAYEYRGRVAALGQGIVAGLPPGPLAARVRLVGLVGVPLAGGGFLRIQLNRQPSGPGYRRPSNCELAAMLGPLMVSPPNTAGCAKPRRVAARSVAGS